MKKAWLLLAVVCAALVAPNASAANRVYIESKHFAVASGACTVGVYVDNTHPVGRITLALELVSVTPNGFPITGLQIVRNPAGRLSGSLTTTTYGTASGTCFEGGGDFQEAGPANGSSPDAVFASLHNICHQPGVDPAGIPSFFIIFNASADIGQFDIRKCCTPSGVTFMNGLGCTEGDFAPEVTPGRITNAWITDGQCNLIPTDVNCDGATNIVDVVALVDRAFRGQAAPAPCCAAE